MSDSTSEAKDRHPSLTPAGYEPPRTERVLAPAELEQEMLYAGIEVVSVSTTDG